MLVATPALAQAAEPAADAKTVTEEAESNDIIVTAQRRAERLEDVPMTIVAVSEERLDSGGVTSLRDLDKVVTGFQLGYGGAYPQPSLRGVTSLLNGNFENNVAIYVDGFYEPAAQAINIDLPNVESIQVLKGPQGTLYGRNATAGAILLNTKTPGDSWEGKAELTYARFDDKRASAYISGPLGDRIGLSVAGYVRKSDGYMKMADRVTPGATDGKSAPLDQQAIRIKLRAELTDNLTATLGYNYVHIRDPRGEMFTPLENVGSLVNVPTRPRELGVAAFDYENMVDSKEHQGTLTLELDTGIGTLKSHTGYTDFLPVTTFDFDGTYANLVWSRIIFRQKTFQQAVDFAIDAIDKVDLVVGGLFFSDRMRSHPGDFLNYTGKALLGLPVTTPITTPPPFSDLVLTEERLFRQDKDAWAVYLDANIHATDKLTLNLGGRYSHERQKVFGASVNPFSGGVLFPPTNKRSTYKRFTPRASITYEVAPRSNVYLSYSQGFRSGVWNASFPTPPAGPDQWVDAKQETLTAYEIGFKTAGRNYRFEVSGFIYDIKNLQYGVTQCIGAPTCIPTLVIANAPKAKVKGIEAAFEVTPVENLKLAGGASWLHARYGDGFIFGGVGVGNTAAFNTNSDPLKALLNQNQIQDLSGLQMSRAPDFTANFGAEYHIPQGDGGLRFAVNVNYTDSYVVSNPSVWGTAASVPVGRQREQRFREGAYALVGARITWTHPGGNYYVQVFGNNLTDHRYRLHYSGTPTFGTFSPMAEPRTYGARIGYKF